MSAVHTRNCMSFSLRRALAPALARAPALLLGRQSQYFPVEAVGHDIERAVRPLVDASNPTLELAQETLLGDDAVAVHHEASERPADQFGDEEIPVPLGKQFAVVKGDAGWGDVGRPEIHRLLHPFLRRLVAVDG